MSTREDMENALSHAVARARAPILESGQESETEIVADCMRLLSASPLPEEFRRILAEHDQLRAALVGMVGSDDPEELRAVIGAIESVDDDDARAAVAAARALLEVRP